MSDPLDRSGEDPPGGNRGDRLRPDSLAGIFDSFRYPGILFETISGLLRGLREGI